MPTSFHSRLLPAVCVAVCSLGVANGASAGPGTVAVAASAITVAQNFQSVSITVNRRGGSSGAATAMYGTHSGTALVDHDYTGAAGTVHWASGDASSKIITIKLVQTAVFSGTKSFAVTLSKTTGAALSTPASTTVTIKGSVSAGTGGGSGPAAKLAAKLGKPSRLLVGLGGQGATVDAVSAIESQAAKVDIYERYLGTGDWTRWNSAPCDYVCVVADAADSLGAIPMFTQYQMADDGDGNLAVVNNSAFMKTYWSRLKLLFEDIAAYNKPVLVNLEPDFWGYVERAAPNSDPSKMTAIVNSNPDCAALHNNVAGIAGCMIEMARKYAPKAYIGFPPSSWGGNTAADVVTFMNAIGAQNADFIVNQTSDRDQGCIESLPQPSYCSRSTTGWYYWDETNETHPNFQDHLIEAKTYHTGIGNLPLIWWQTPQGVPSTSRGGSAFHYRDNRMHYFLTHPAELVAAGGLGVVFGAGEIHQTNITTDGGQFQELDSAYFASPAKLP